MDNASKGNPARGSNGASGAAAPTSGSREESMDEAGSDGFGGAPPPPDPHPEDQGDGTSDDLAETPEPTKQNPASSGTTSIGGEPKDAESIKSSGGVEGTG